jgi:hypothetical protein
MLFFKFMVEEINVQELKNLPLEERAKKLLESYNKGACVKGEHSLASFVPLFEAWRYLEVKEFVKLVGGTLESGARYMVTEKGYDFIKD